MIELNILYAVFVPRGAANYRYCGAGADGKEWVLLKKAWHEAQRVEETTINIIDALRGQQEQLKRLLAQKVLISDAPRADLSEIEAQVIEIKRLLAEFEKVIQDYRTQ